MAKVVWTEPALADLDAIADYVAVDNPLAARGLIARIFERIEQLETHPLSGPRVPELRRSRYRQLVEPPCRVFYRFEGRTVFVVHVMRSEMILRVKRLKL